MESNPHAATAKAMLGNTEAPVPADTIEGLYYALEANAHATLALVHAQETANLIAALAEYGPDLHTKTRDIRTAYQSMTVELKARMGIATTEGKNTP